MKFYEIERIKQALGLPASASVSDIETRIAQLKEKEEELEVLKSEGKTSPRGFWQKIFGGR